jgi:hypothetical protein
LAAAMLGIINSYLQNSCAGRNPVRPAVSYYWIPLFKGISRALSGEVDTGAPLGKRDKTNG